MNQECMGQLISQLRKSKQMTQKELADQLNITDKAVSKWERGLSYPDITLLPALAEALGVTISELLNGAVSQRDKIEEEATIEDVVQYADKTVTNRTKRLLTICAFSYSLLLLLGVMVCAICDLAISGALTWSKIPICAIVFAWLLGFPALKFGKKGVWISLAALSVFIIPFLVVLDQLVETGGLLLPIGSKTAAISVCYLWIALAAVKRLKMRKLLICVVLLILLIPVQTLINMIVSAAVSEPLFDAWDMVSICAAVVIVLVLLAIDYFWRRKALTQEPREESTP